MSILRALPRAPTWNTSEHVCLCCRRRLAQRQQTRGYNSALGLQQFDDDWASNLDNLDAGSQVKESEDAVRGHEDFRKLPATKKDGRSFKWIEARRQRRAGEGTPDFETLKNRLDSRLDEGSAISDSNGLRESFRPFAYNLEYVPKDVTPTASSSDAPRTSSRRRWRHSAMVDEHQPRPVATPASADRVRDAKSEAIIRELKADLAAKLPQIMSGVAMKSKQISSLDRPGDAHAVQHLRISEEPPGSDSSNHTYHVRARSVRYTGSTAKRPGESSLKDPTTGADKSDETRFRKLYNDVVKTTYQGSKSISSPPAGLAEDHESWSVFGPVQHQVGYSTATNVSRSTDSKHISSDVARLSPLGLETSSGDTSLDQLKLSKPGSRTPDPLFSLEQKAKNRVEAQGKDQEKADSALLNADSRFISNAQNSQEQKFLADPSLDTGTIDVANQANTTTTDPLSVLSRLHETGLAAYYDTAVANSAAGNSPERLDSKVHRRLKPIAIAGPGTLFNTACSMIKFDRPEVRFVHNASKRFMSITSRRRASPASNVETHAAAGSSLEQISPWEVGSSDSKHASHDTQQSSNEAQQPFLSLLPAAKRKKPTHAAKNEVKEKNNNTSKKRAKRVSVTSDNVAEVLQSLLSKEQSRKGKKEKDQPSDEKLIKEKPARPSVKAAKGKTKESEGGTASKGKSEHMADQASSSPKPDRRTRRARTFRKHPATVNTSKRMVSPRRMRILRVRNGKLVNYSHPPARVNIDQAIKGHRTRKPNHVGKATKVSETNGAGMARELHYTRDLGTLQHELSQAMSAREASTVVSIDAANLVITPLNLSQPPVPGLQYGLDRTLFNPGVFQLQDPHSRVYNFDPYLQKIMPVMEFDYNALKQYKTSSQDTALAELAKEYGKQYIGSTSSMTGTLGHFHYLISAFRTLNLKMLSRSFPDNLESFTQINRAPNAIFLRSKGDGIYAIDADKEFDGPNVLMMLGKSMEKLLTLPKEDYERYRKENSHEVTEEERTAPEAFQYTTMGSFLMRSQLDAHDPRLPGTGMFDLKTRAVVSVRMNTEDYEPMTGYEIQTLQGRFQSYEREYYDMMRSTMLKYMLQVRMGRMDGILLAYHNVERIFGFQYVPLHEMDRALHWQTDPALGNQEFRLSLDLLNKVLDKATAKFPDQSLRLHFETSEEQIGSGNPTIMMWIFAEPMAEDQINEIQSASHERTAEFERNMMGIERNESDDLEDVEFDAAVIGDVGEVEASAPSATEDPAATEPYSTSASDAAPTFSAELEKPREIKPLFSASIVCKSRVNDTVVQRPDHLKAEDKWELEYLLQEWDTTEMMWARYEDVKSRRKRVLEQNLKDKEQEDGENGGNGKKKNGGYVEFLKSMSEKGRAFRDKMDELDAGKAPVVIGQPLFASQDPVEKNIEGIDDYLGWLYRGDIQAAQKS